MAIDLFTPLDMGPLHLANRIVMAPMTRSRSTGDHVPTPIMADYYGARAAAGLLISEGVAPEPDGCGYPRIPGLWNQQQVDAWKPVTDAVHAAGGLIAAQLMHTGRVGHPLNMPEGSSVLAPSVSRMSGEMYTDSQGPQPYPEARAMSGAEVERAIESYVVAAKNAMLAGFDAVELHGANGYLIDQFLTPSANQRTDGWGGEIAGRARFALTVADRCAAAIGRERLGIRLSPCGVFNDIQPWDGIEDDFLWLATELGRLGLAWMHIVDHSSMGAPAVPAALKQGMKARFGGTFILSGDYDRARADQDLAAGRGDLVAFGRAFLANPDLPARLKSGAELNAPDFSTFYTPGEKGYTDYPTLA